MRMTENVTSLGELFHDYETIGNVHIRKSLWQHKDMKIYHYLRVGYLLTLLRKKTLYVNNRALFSDVREQGIMENLKYNFDIFLRHPHNKEEREKNREDLKRLTTLKNLAFKSCISCWTKGVSYSQECNEDITEWDHYGTGKAQYGETCRIETTIEQLVNAIQSSPNPMWLSEVQYDKEKMRGTPEKWIFWKYYAYEQEHELRLCIDTHQEHISLDISPENLINNICLSPYIQKDERQYIIENIEEQYPWLIGKIYESHLLEKHN